MFIAITNRLGKLKTIFAAIFSFSRRFNAILRYFAAACAFVVSLQDVAKLTKTLNLGFYKAAFLPA